MAGRPTDYDPSFCQIAADACINGATDEEIADTLGVCARTIYRWKIQHPEFSQALRVGKELCDERVERSLYNRAVGYTYDAVKINVDKGDVIITPYKEHCPPDVAAQKLWLTNRRAEQWKERSSKEISGPNGGAIKLDTTGDIEQARRIAFALGRALERSRMKVIEHDAS
jgi:hypothetical protein